MDGFRMELWNACAKGSVDVVRAMVALPGVNVNARKYHNDTYLLIAASCGQAEVVRVLLGVPGIEANVADIFGTTPLCAACSAGHVEVVEALLESPEIRGVVNARKGTRMSRPEELTPLHHAIGGGHVEVVKALLGVPEVNVNVADSTGRTPLHAALRRGTTEIVEVLEAAGAIVSPTMHSAILDHDAEEVARQLAGGEWNAHRINSLHGTGGTVDETLLHVAAAGRAGRRREHSKQAGGDTSRGGGQGRPRCSCGGAAGCTGGGDQSAGRGGPDAAPPRHYPDGKSSRLPTRQDGARAARVSVVPGSGGQRAGCSVPKAAPLRRRAVRPGGGACAADALSWR